MKHLSTGAENVPPQAAPILPHEVQIRFALLCGNDSFSQWFYQDIMANRGRGIQESMR
jgi:hypothetical protein